MKRKFQNVDMLDSYDSEKNILPLSKKPKLQKIYSFADLNNDEREHLSTFLMGQSSQALSNLSQRKFASQQGLTTVPYLQKPKTIFLELDVDQEYTSEQFNHFFHSLIQYDRIIISCKNEDDDDDEKVGAPLLGYILTQISTLQETNKNHVLEIYIRSFSPQYYATHKFPSNWTIHISFFFINHYSKSVKNQFSENVVFHFVHFSHLIQYNQYQIFQTPRLNKHLVDVVLADTIIDALIKALETNVFALDEVYIPSNKNRIKVYSFFKSLFEIKNHWVPNRFTILFKPDDFTNIIPLASLWYQYTKKPVFVSMFDSAHHYMEMTTQENINQLQPSLKLRIQNMISFFNTMNENNIPFNPITSMNIRQSIMQQILPQKSFFHKTDFYVKRKNYTKKQQLNELQSIYPAYHITRDPNRFWIYKLTPKQFE